MEELRRNFGETLEEFRENFREKQEELNDTQKKIIQLLSTDGSRTAAELSEKIGITRRSIEMNIRNLKDRGILVRHGPAKGGYWEVKKIK